VIFFSAIASSSVYSLPWLGHQQQLLQFRVLGFSSITTAVTD